MSAITSDWTSIEIEAPAPHTGEKRQELRREEVFRSALDSYMDSYIADQRKRRAVATGSTSCSALT